MQRVLNSYRELAEILRDAGKILFVHGKSAENFTRLHECLNSVSVEHFTDYTPNPKLEDAISASEFFRSKGCAFILTVGGGTAIDVAKYVKLNNPDSLLAVIPTTAGSGSEATRFAVLYRDGVKLSITDDIMIPDYVLFDPELLKYLPEYHRKSSALDAMCHALESFWSVNATQQSREFSRTALTDITRMLTNYPESYDPDKMLRASYTAGKAINIAQTTAGHAMCYKITSLFGTAHGHSAALCIRVLFRRLTENSRLDVLNDIASAMGCSSPVSAAEKFEEIFSRLGLNVPEASEQEIDILASSVNTERLKNFPVVMDNDTIRKLYREILTVKE